MAGTAWKEGAKQLLNKEYLWYNIKIYREVFWEGSVLYGEKKQKR